MSQHFDTVRMLVGGRTRGASTGMAVDSGEEHQTLNLNTHMMLRKHSSQMPMVNPMYLHDSQAKLPSSSILQLSLDVSHPLFGL